MPICPIETPQCKRKLMTSSEPYEKKQCPLNVKPKCSLARPSCPLLPSDDDICIMAKLKDPNSKVAVSNCPGRCCCCALAPVKCPVDLNVPEPANDTNIENFRVKSKSPFTSCPISACVNSKTSKIETEDNSERSSKLMAVNNTESIQSFTKVKKVPSRQKVQGKQDLSNTAQGTKANTGRCCGCLVDSIKDGGIKIKMRRPLPCSQCIVDMLTEGTKALTCPYLKIADKCPPTCECVQVPDVDVDPPCPFAPKPCPCCTTPRCPLSRKPDCALNTKPQCCLLTPKCCCGSCPVGPPSCKVKSPTCFCGSCPLPPDPCMDDKANCSNCPLKTSKCCCSKPPCCPPPSCPLNPCPPPPCLPCSPPPCFPCPPPPCLPCPPSCCPCPPPSCPLNFCPPNPCFPCPPPSCPLAACLCLCSKPTCPIIPLPCKKEAFTDIEEDFKPPEPTFHLPTCSQYKPPCQLHTAGGGNGKQLVCPFSPHPCPLGDTCPFPVQIGVENNIRRSSTKSDKGRLSQTPKVPATSDVVRQCPGCLACGSSPDPDCPAAEILTPKAYKKRQKQKEKMKKKKPFCPLEKCVKKEDCPLSAMAASPGTPCCPCNSVCPLSEFAPKSNVCPPPKCCLSTNTDCPLSTLADKPKCALPPPNPPCCCSNLRKDGVNSAKSTSLTALSDISIKSTSSDSSEESSDECPFERCFPKLNCSLAPRECPLTPKSKCPLTRKPDVCPLSLPNDRPNCPIEFPPCCKFPGGRCPMTDLNLCDCEYPIAPCLLPPQDEDVMAPPQYCLQDDCCMGLPLPPVKPNPLTISSTGNGDGEASYYKWMDTKPGRPETKHYVEILKEPPTLDSGLSLFQGRTERLNNNNTVIKAGEGFKKCKTIAKKLDEMGPTETVKSQYQEGDYLPMDPEAILLNEYKKNRNEVD